MCTLCDHSAEPGWLCADHPGQPWQHEGCGGEGMACVCNPTGAVQWQQVFADNDVPEQLQ